MTKHRRVRTLADTGSTTGAATVVLALLSAGALAGLGLIASTELAPGPAPSVAPNSAERAVNPPRSVVVGPGRPTAANPTPGSPPVPGTPTPSPGTAPEPAFLEPLPPVLAGPLLPIPEVVIPGVLDPGVLDPSAPLAPTPRLVRGFLADRPGTSGDKDVAEKAAKAKQAKHGKHAKKARKAKKTQPASDALEAREEKAAQRATHALDTKATEAAEAEKATNKAVGKHRR